MSYIVVAKQRSSDVPQVSNRNAMTARFTKAHSQPERAPSPIGANTGTASNAAANAIQYELTYLGTFC